MFVYIPASLRMKRWDRYYQYRYMKILKCRKEHGDRTKVNSRNVYRKYKVLEGCQYDIEAVNAFYRDPFVAEDAGDAEAKMEYDGYFEAEVGAHGLPKGYAWKLQCPVMGLELEQRGDNVKYCGVCRSNVYLVEDEQELKQKVAHGQCVQLGKANLRRAVRGRIVRRRPSI